jgi:hypothetical protein
LKSTCVNCIIQPVIFSHLCKYQFKRICKYIRVRVEWSGRGKFDRKEKVRRCAVWRDDVLHGSNTIKSSDSHKNHIKGNEEWKWAIHNIICIEGNSLCLPSLFSCVYIFAFLCKFLFHPPPFTMQKFPSKRDEKHVFLSLYVEWSAYIMFSSLNLEVDLFKYRRVADKSFL